MSDDLASAHHELIGINSFLACLVVLLCLTLGGLLQRYEVHQLSASGASILFGAALGLILSAIVPHSEEASIIAFNPEFFFFILLPPIIFDSGQCERRNNCKSDCCNTGPTLVELRTLTHL